MELSSACETEGECEANNTPRASTVTALGRGRVSLRLGHARVLTTHRVVIHYAHAASLPHGEGEALLEIAEEAFRLP